VAYLVEVFLPVTARGWDERFERVRAELTEKFGGATFHVNAPAEGLWKDGGEVEHDRIVVGEIMVEELDRAWWTTYRTLLEKQFEQQSIVVRATAIERL
jgi:hypothetical protein